MPKIELLNAGITFKVRQTPKVTLKEYLLRGMFLGNVNPKTTVRALSELHLQAHEGDRIGVIGHNGAGKSTLLKLMAGIYPPSTGRCNVEGRICSMFDITLGFEDEASGWENIKYRAYFQGESPKNLKRKMASIAEFSELGDFLNTPVRYYSAGMRVRLAFAIATAVEPEILLVDEVLGVGDRAFQVKARERMRELVSTARIMVMVSHDLESIINNCNRVIWLDHGRIIRSGPAHEIVAEYTGTSGHTEPHLANSIACEEAGWKAVA